MTASETAFAQQVAGLLPAQGEWTESDYLWLTNHTNRLVELTDGHIEVLLMPTERHQALVAFLYVLLRSFAERIKGKVVFAPFRLRLPSGKFREPDLLLLRSARDPRRHNAFWDGADLVVEVLSEDDPSRDLVTKRSEYALAGVPEYWIVDGQSETVIVLRLEDSAYVVHGTFGRGTVVESALAPDLLFPVTDLLDAE